MNSHNFCYIMSDRVSLTICHIYNKYSRRIIVNQIICYLYALELYLESNLSVISVTSIFDEHKNNDTEMGLSAELYACIPIAFAIFVWMWLFRECFWWYQKILYIAIPTYTSSAQRAHWLQKDWFWQYAECETILLYLIWKLKITFSENARLISIQIS